MVDERFLASIPIFSELTPDALQELSQSWQLSTKAADEVIFKKGDAGESIFLILEGSVQISILALLGGDLTLTVLESGDIFGELTLFDGAPRTAYAKALTRTELLEMPREKFINFINKYPSVSIALLGILGKRLRETNQLMERQTARNVNLELEKQLSFGERFSDKFAEFVGSWTFIIGFLCFLLGWMGLNFYAILFTPIDPFPFLLLNFCLSCIATIQGPVILMSQRRQAKKDSITSDLDYKVNLKAELQIQEIMLRLDELRRQTQQNLTQIQLLQRDMLATELEISDKCSEIMSKEKK